jgi:hypothetical protein
MSPCSWQAATDQCIFASPAVQPLGLVLLLSLAALLSYPLICCGNHCLRSIRIYHESCAAQKREARNVVETEYSKSSFLSDEFVLFQTKRSKMMLAARLQKACEVMDYVVTLDEVRHLLFVLSLCCSVVSLLCPSFCFVVAVLLCFLITRSLPIHFQSSKNSIHFTINDCNHQINSIRRRALCLPTSKSISRPGRPRRASQI